MKYLLNFWIWKDKNGWFIPAIWLLLLSCCLLFKPKFALPFLFISLFFYVIRIINTPKKIHGLHDVEEMERISRKTYD